MTDLVDLYEIDEQLNAALDADAPDAYEALVRQREAPVAELDDGGEVETVKAAKKAEAAKEVAGSAANQVKAIEHNLTLARKRLDELNSQPSDRRPGEAPNEEAIERNNLAAEIAAAERDLELMQARLPFVDITDDDVLEDTKLTTMAELEAARAELEGLGAVAGFMGTRELLEKRISALAPKVNALTTEHHIRTQEAKNSRIAAEMATAKALSKRAQAIEEWEHAKARASAESNYQAALDSLKAVDAIKSLPDKPSQKELEPYLAEFAGKRMPGSWH